MAPYDPDAPLPDLEMLADGGADLSDDDRQALVSRALYDLERLKLEERAIHELLASLLGLDGRDLDAIVDRAEADDAAEAAAIAPDDTA